MIAWNKSLDKSDAAGHRRSMFAMLQESSYEMLNCLCTPCTEHQR